MGNTVGSQTSLGKNQEKVLLGTLLGDGIMELNGNYPRFRVDHSIKQKEYVKWKYDIFQNLTLSGIKYCFQKLDSRTGKRYSHCKFSTISIPLLEKFYQMFYVDGKKQVPKNILNLLIDPLSLAVWYMDDGYKRSDCNALRISTNSFTKYEISLLQTALKKNFDIKSKQHQQSKNQYVIYIPSSESRKFCDIIKPFVIKHFSYKLI